MPAKPITIKVDPEVGRRVLEAVRSDMRSMVESGTYTDNPARFARLAEGAEQLSSSLRKRR